MRKDNAKTLLASLAEEAVVKVGCRWDYDFGKARKSFQVMLKSVYHVRISSRFGC